MQYHRASLSGKFDFRFDPVPGQKFAQLVYGMPLGNAVGAEIDEHVLGLYKCQVCRFEFRG